MQRALLLALSIASIPSFALPDSTGLAYFYSGLNCRRQMVFTSYAAQKNGDWIFGNCWGLTGIKARSVYFTNTNRCIGVLPIHVFRCDRNGWVVGR